MKNTNKKKYRIKWKNVLVLVTCIMSVAYLCSAVFLKSYNVGLADEQKKINKEITTMKAEVDAMTMQVKDLSEYTRVLDMIDDKTMSNADTKVVTLSQAQ